MVSEFEEIGDVLGIMSKEDLMHFLDQVKSGNLPDEILRNLPPEISQLLNKNIAGMPGNQTKKEIKLHDAWWKNYHHEIPNLDPLDITVSALAYPTSLADMELSDRAKKSLVIDEVTMRDLKLIELTDSIDITHTRAGRRMLEYLVHFPLNDLGEIKKRQDAIKEISANPMAIHAFDQCYDRMSKFERGFLEFTFPQEGGAPPRQDTFQAARQYLAGISQLHALLKHFKSDKLSEIKDNLETLFAKDNIRKLYREVINGDDADIMALHPSVWTRSLSRYIIDTMNAFAPVMRALSFSNIKTDLSTGEFRLSPRKDGESININYPIGLSLDLKEMRKIYFDQNKIFNLYYTAGFLEGLCSLSALVVRMNGPIVFPEFRQTERFECNAKNPADPYILLSQGRFNPNSYLIDSETRGFVITGPNTGGKTVYGFTLPKIQILAQTGTFIPAEYIQTSIADHIFTLRPASKENVGQGRYLHSLVRGREIFEKATQRSFVAIDDFEGTDPEDCYKESLVMLKNLARIGNAFTMTTQDRRVAFEIANCPNGEYKGIKTVQLRVEPEGDRVRLYYQVIPGIGASIGEACAKGAGMDSGSLDDLMRQRGF